VDLDAVVEPGHANRRSRTLIHPVEDGVPDQLAKGLFWVVGRLDPERSADCGRMSDVEANHLVDLSNLIDEGPR